MDKFAEAVSDTFCVFQCGSTQYGVPALCVRELLPRPSLAAVPRMHPVVVGLCHVRNHFLPLISGRILTGEPAPSFHEEEQLLIIEAATIHWGLLVDRVSGLAALDVTFDLAANVSETSSTATLGWASCKDGMIRILDPGGLYRQAHELVRDSWQHQTKVVRKARPRELLPPPASLG